jgi:hypothetical protein
MHEIAALLKSLEIEARLLLFFLQRVEIVEVRGARSAVKHVKAGFWVIWLD